MSISMLWQLLVVLILYGLWLLFLRVLKIPSNLRSTTLDQARRLIFFNDAFMLIMAGAVWIVAWATKQFTETWGIIFLTIGIVYLIQGFLWKAGEQPSSPKSRQPSHSSDTFKE